jgi:hypothetical protein
VSRFVLQNVVMLGVLAGAAHAQSIPNINAPKQAAQRAAQATNNNISEQTGQEVKRVGQPAPAPTGKASGPAADNTKDAKATAPAATVAMGEIPPVTREIFSYAADSRRDPFFSLILTEELRPLLSDLKLVGILYAGGGGGRSVAIMRDVQTNAQYRVSAGMGLGRMRVDVIRPRAVIFTIDEFGLKRQDSLFLADTSKTRIR